MKHILTVTFCLAASTAFSQNQPATIKAPAAIIVNDDKPVDVSRKVNPALNKVSPNPVVLPLQKTASPQIVVAPVPPVDKVTELKGVAIDQNSQKGFAPVNRDRPKTSTLTTTKPVQEPKPAAIVVKSIQ